MDDLKVGDMVMVIMQDNPLYSAGRPRAGAIGQVSKSCHCLHAILGLTAYGVKFDAEREYCYRRRDLKKLDPPADSDETTHEREKELV